MILGSNATGPGSAGLLAALAGAEAEVIQRHGASGPYVPPHRIDHEANLRSLLERGCDRVLAVCSVGSLKPEIAVGSLVCPDDFIALQLGLTSFDDARGHVAPGFDADWRERDPGRLAGGRRAGARGRRRLLADDRAPLRDPGRDPAARRPRRPGRDDDGLGVHRLRRARARLRGDLHGRQPRQRDRLRAAQRRGARGRPRRERRRASATPSRRCCRSWQ